VSVRVCAYVYMCVCDIMCIHLKIPIED